MSSGVMIKMGHLFVVFFSFSCEKLTENINNSLFTCTNLCSVKLNSVVMEVDVFLVSGQSVLGW